MTIHDDSCEVHPGTTARYCSVCLKELEVELAEKESLLHNAAAAAVSAQRDRDRYREALETINSLTGHARGVANEAAAAYRAHQIASAALMALPSERPNK